MKWPQQVGSLRPWLRPQEESARFFPALLRPVGPPFRVNSQTESTELFFGLGSG